MNMQARPSRALQLLLAGVLCGLDATAAAPGKAPAAADIALRNGSIYTVDGARSWAQALAIRGGRIVYVGTDAGLKPFLGAATRQVDLHGRMVLPGFQDAHIHPISGGIQANTCDLDGLKTPGEYVAAVRQCAAARPDAAWITGGGWLLSAFGPGGVARRELLDAAVPDRPVYLSSSDGHTVWVNSRALELAHITADTPDPKDGRIDRDPTTHQPAGTLQEGASAAVDAVMPPASLAERLAGLEYAVRMLNGYGITGIQDASVSEDDLKAYRELERRGGLSLHVVTAQWWERREGLEQIARFERLRREYRSPLIDTSTIKIMQDGVMENFTAVMLDPYLKPDGGRGIPMVEPRLLQEAVTRLDARGFQVHFHTIGDGAVRQALDAIEAARARNGDLGHRHHLSHLELIDPADVPRFRALGAVANFQPLWAFSDPYITELTAPFLGPARMQHIYPIGSMLRSGAMLAFGSDWSVSTANPFEEIQVAVTRMGPAGEGGQPFLPDERIGLADALAAFTIGSAYVNRLEKETGSLEVGKRADLVVLDQDLFAVPANEIARTHALVTMFGGRVVHGDLAALSGKGNGNMDLSAIEDSARRYAAAWCGHDAARVAAFYAEAGSLTINGGAPANGRAAVQKAVQEFMTAYPDLVVTFERLEPRGERVLFHWGFTGTNTGPGGTGNAVRINGYEDWRIGADGLVAESLGHYDARDWQRQAGSKH